MIAVDVLNQTRQKIPVSNIKKVVEGAIKNLNLGEDVEISIVLVSPKKIRIINKKYRQKSCVTDVLSFSSGGPDKIYPGQARNLGDILICLEQARIQAKAQNHSLKKELEILTVHGVMHLLGLDHEKDKKTWANILTKIEGKR